MWLLFILLLILVIAFVVYIYYKNSQPKATSNGTILEGATNNKYKITNFKSNKLHDSEVSDEPTNESDNSNNESIESNNDIDSLIENTKIKLKPHFMEMQFHNDYRDVITSLNDVAPIQKQVFNGDNCPVEYTKPSHKEVNDLINEFIKELNKNIKKNVSDYRNANTGWDEQLPEPIAKSGWDKQQEELGLPSSLYPAPAKKAPVKLLKIDDVEKYTTKTETRYVCTIIIQKMNVDDQMIIKIYFLKNNKDNKKICDVIIEEIFIVGFLTDRSLPERGNKADDFYNFKGLNNNDVVNDQTIMKELIKKYQDKSKDDRKFAQSLNEEDRIFHDSRRDVTTYNSFQGTRFICDDLQKKPICYE